MGADAMIKINSRVRRELVPFWNHALFHPTDAVEDPWGKRILDRMAEDRAIDTIRIYAMLEDIVYRDGEGNLAYDFRLCDLRIDYLLSKGFNLLIALGGMPDCIARSVGNKTSVSKNKTRYKGKMFNTSPPASPELWEEVCFRFFEHIVDRYGIEAACRWQFQCFNEPDIAYFFMSELGESDECDKIRAREYNIMYEAFQRAALKVSDRLQIGGPALAYRQGFLGLFLDNVREKSLKLDFISVHAYGTGVPELNSGKDRITVANNIHKHEKHVKTIRDHGFGDTPLVVDEWGASGQGFYNIDECPTLIFRENEIFASYFTKMIYEFIERDYKMSKLMICLSGQHEMTEDFSGFRNFFTLNFITKPIYNAHMLSGYLRRNLVSADHTCENLHIIPTADGGEYGIMLTYSSEYFDESLPEREEQIVFDKSIEGKCVTVYSIDLYNNNPYRLAQRESFGRHPDAEAVKRLREEGKLKPIRQFIAKGDEPISLTLTANCTCFIDIK